MNNQSKRLDAYSTAIKITGLHTMVINRKTVIIYNFTAVKSAESEDSPMKIAIFSKKKTKNDERKTVFYIYLTQLTNKTTGETFPVRVKFRDEAGKPDPSKTPMFIEFDKSDANMISERYTTDEGETRETKTLWIAKWRDAGAYVDHSLDDFE